MYRLVVRADGRDLCAWNLKPGRTVVGRSDRCDLVVPADTVSRTHFVVDVQGDQATLVNRSRRGTCLNGEPVDRKALNAGDVVGLDAYEIVVQRVASSVDESPTVAPVVPRDHEAVIRVDEARYEVRRPVIRVGNGDHTPVERVIATGRLTLGGPGADWVVHDGGPPDALALRASLGRVMVEPARWPVFLDGRRVATLTPLWPGDVLTSGPLRVEVRADQRQEAVPEATEFGDLLGAAPPMRRLFGILGRVAAHEEPALLIGESGTGKELAAKAVHDASRRHEGPFVAVNCAAIADTLFESELFGHEKGAFTGATQRQDGAFQQASKGTLFLDEVAELRLDLQAKLLRALESGEVRRVGGARPEFPDVRVVAATHRDLLAMSRRGEFRSDLYYRLAVLTVRLPTLRERITDLPMLAQGLLRRIDPVARIDNDAMERLLGYQWPGNVRELRNVLTRAVVLGGPIVSAESLEFVPGVFEDPAETGHIDDPDREERGRIARALSDARGNRALAARNLGIARSSLLYRLRRLGMDGA